MTAPVSPYSAIAEQVESRAAEIEELRRLPADLVAAIVETGVMKLWVASAYGGAQACVQEVVDAVAAVSYHDASAGWCVMIANSTAWTSGHLPSRYGKEIFGPEDAMAGGFAMPAVDAVAEDGGLRASGTWPWGSGTSHSTMIGGGVRVVDHEGRPSTLADGSSTAFAFFDPADIEILDTWYVGGLKGTGSNDYRADDVFVPEGRWVDLISARERGPVIDEPLYHFPFFGAFACTVAAVIGGLAHRAVDELNALGDKHPAGSRRGLSKRPALQAELARAESAVRSTKAFMAEAIGTTTEAVEAGSLNDEHRRLLRLAATDMALRGATAVDRCHRAAGGASVFTSSPLERIFRDTHAASQHAMVSDRTLEPLGALAFGLDIDTAQI